jgi:hypothetical protein
MKRNLRATLATLVFVATFATTAFTLPVTLPGQAQAACELAEVLAPGDYDCTTYTG